MESCMGVHGTFLCWSDWNSSRRFKLATSWQWVITIVHFFYLQLPKRYESKKKQRSWFIDAASLKCAQFSMADCLKDCAFKWVQNWKSAITSSDHILWNPEHDPWERTQKINFYALLNRLSKIGIFIPWRGDWKDQCPWEIGALFWNDSSLYRKGRSDTKKSGTLYSNSQTLWDGLENLRDGMSWFRD